MSGASASEDCLVILPYARKKEEARRKRTDCVSLAGRGVGRCFVAPSWHVTGYTSRRAVPALRCGDWLEGDRIEMDDGRRRRRHAVIAENRESTCSGPWWNVVKALGCTVTLVAARAHRPPCPS